MSSQRAIQAAEARAQAASEAAATFLVEEEAKIRAEAQAAARLVLKDELDALTVKTAQLNDALQAAQSELRQVCSSCSRCPHRRKVLPVSELCWVALLDHDDDTESRWRL